MLKVKSGHVNGAASEWEPIDVTEQDIRLLFNRLFTEYEGEIGLHELSLLRSSRYAGECWNNGIMGDLVLSNVKEGNWDSGLSPKLY